MGRPGRLPFISSPRLSGDMERSGHNCWAQSRERSAWSGIMQMSEPQAAVAVLVHPALQEEESYFSLGDDPAGTDARPVSA